MNGARLKQQQRMHQEQDAEPHTLAVQQRRSTRVLGVQHHSTRPAENRELKQAIPPTRAHTQVLQL